MPTFRAVLPLGMDPCTLLVGTHRALYKVSIGAPHTPSLVHTGAGHYYGVTPASAFSAALNGSLLVGSQARGSERDAVFRERLGRIDALLLLDSTGHLRTSWQLPTRYLHDTVYADGKLYSVDTMGGLIYAHRLVHEASGGDARDGWVLRPAGRVRAATSSLEHINSVSFGGGGRGRGAGKLEQRYSSTSPWREELYE